MAYCHDHCGVGQVSNGTEAAALLAGDPVIAERLASKLLIPRKDNFVARPWGGRNLAAFKQVSSAILGGPFGESFELSADDRDAEARAHPSKIELDDGSDVSLPALLVAHGERLLGHDFLRRYGARWPLLPKLLDVAEILSVQAHPPGNTEVYVVVAADVGATIRLGFSRDVDADALEAQLVRGRREQRRLLELCGPAVDQQALHRDLQRFFTARSQPLEVSGAAFDSVAHKGAGAEFAALAASLRELYWHVLDELNAVPVEAGQVLYNANPARLVAAGAPRSAEAHALGDPEGREILALEIRRPGPTLRAWDNVRFPLREIDVGGALAALNLRATTPEEFIVAPQPVPGRPGVSRSVVDEHFRIEHLAPTLLASIDVPASAPHSLHLLEGAVSVYATDGEIVGRLARGDSALVPCGVGAYRVVADTPQAMLVKVDLPPYDA